MQGQVRIGTSGWVYRHWRGRFYPERLRGGEWFSWYARHFDTVELNNSFYRLPSEAAVEQWRAQAPAGFIYAMKASRFLTHMKKLNEPDEPIARILGRARLLGPHLGPVLYQLPPHWACNLPRLRTFIAALPRDVQHVFEFRDPSWCNDEVRALLAETRMNFCIHDMAEFQCFPWVTGPIIFLRFHGPRKYAGRYDAAWIAAWAERIRAWRDEGRDVYGYFNNDEGANAVVNALELKERVG